MLKVHPMTGHEGSEWEQKYISAVSLKMVLFGGGWSTLGRAYFNPVKETRYPFYRGQDGS
jgi:hypothetical protein